MGNADTKAREAFKAEIDAKNTRYLESYLNRKFDRIAEMYTDECRFMPAGFPMQIGPKGIADFWARIVDLGFYKLTFMTEETLGPVGDMACERCVYFFNDAKGKELQRGKYIVIWKKVNGEWKYDQDIWNPDHLDMIKSDAA